MDPEFYEGKVRKEKGVYRNRNKKILALTMAALLLGTGIAEAEDDDGDLFPKDINGNEVSSGTTIIVDRNQASLSNDKSELGETNKEIDGDWGMIAGGLVSEGEGSRRDSSHNKVTVFHSGNRGIYQIYGGWGKRNTEYNEIHFIADGETKIGSSIIGGQSDEGNSSFNTILISGNGSIRQMYDSLKMDIYGGKSEHEVSHNKVVISENANVYIDNLSGAFTKQSPANSNTVEINTTGNVVANYQITGGYADNGLASDNHLTIFNGNVEANAVIGGYSPADNGGISSGNQLNLSGGHVKAYMIAGGYSDGISKGNSVNLKDVNVESNGQSKYAVIAAGAGLTEAKDNKISFDSSIDLSNADIYGWYRVNGTGDIIHSGNQLVVNSTGNKVRGLYNFDEIIFNKTDIGEAALTIVNQGKVDFDETKDKPSVKLTVSALDISEVEKIGQAIILIDASKASSVQGLTELANSLEDSTETLSYKNGEVKVSGISGASVIGDNKLIYGLKTIYEVTYGTLDWKDNGIVVSLDKSRKLDLSDTKVDITHLSFTDDSRKKVTTQEVHQMTLLDTEGNKTLREENITGNDESTWDLGNALTGKGIASLADNGNLMYTIDASEKSVKATEETHHVLMGREGDMALLAAGKDRMMNVFSSLTGKGEEPAVFASVGYGYDRYDTGSHIKSHNWTGVAGAGSEKAMKDGTLSYGLFYERGDGSYKTYNAGFTGKGDNDYNGGGLLLRYMMDNRTYVEGSFRMGHMDSHGDNMLRDASGKPLSYDSDSNYWGTHIGIGHVFDLTDEKASLPAGAERAAKDIDVYGKYFHTHLGSDTVTVNGIDYDLDAMDSDLLRIGSRFNYRQGRNTFYAGIAWDYEMSGKGTGTVSASGMSAPIRSTDTKGGSFMAEAGWKLESAHDNPWTMDVNLAAYGGQHRGIYGNVSVGYRF